MNIEIQTSTFPPEEYFCGDQFLVGVEVVQSRRLFGGKIEWSVITATETGWDLDGESWGSWGQDDVSFWAKMPEKSEAA